MPSSDQRSDSASRVERFSILKQVTQATYNDSYTIHLMVSTNQTISGELNGDGRNCWKIALGKNHFYGWLLIGRRLEGLGKAWENLKRANHALSIIIPGHFFNLQYFSHCIMPALFLFDCAPLSKSLSLTSYLQLNRPLIPSRGDGPHDLTARVQDQGLSQIYPKVNCKSPSLDASN